MGGIPKRWRDYLPVGRRVSGTRFLPFKVPLKAELCRSEPKEDRFTPTLLMERIPSLKAVIDLTDTSRYYDFEDFTTKGILYRKIRITGGGMVPSKQNRKQFFDAVDQLSQELGQDPDALIGVHCTHGLNRTGYLICKYMVLRMKFDPREAIERFQDARGYPIERCNFLNDLMLSERVPAPAPVQNWREEPRRIPGPYGPERSGSTRYRHRQDHHHAYKSRCSSHSTKSKR